MPQAWSNASRGFSGGFVGDSVSPVLDVFVVGVLFTRSALVMALSMVRVRVGQVFLHLAGSLL
jgi:hypothetical protein